MTLSLPTASRNAAADAVVDLADAGSGPAKLRVYTAAFALLLAELVMSEPAFGAAAAGVATAAAITDDSEADATGEAAKFRLVDSDDNTIMEGDVTADGGGGELELTSVSITAGGIVRVTSLTVTMPAS